MKMFHTILKKRVFLILLFPLFCTSIYSSSFIGGRTDFRDETIYFTITTRFYNGDRDNDTYCWDRKDIGDPAWRGDFKGLIEKLDYIKALGFSSVWITPVAENASGYDYHGYHAMNFIKVDPRYESKDVTLKTLVDAVHAKGMKLILDIVLNHTSNFGENGLCPMFKKEGNLSQFDCMKVSPLAKLPTNYTTLPGSSQYQARLAQMKNTDGQNHDANNLYHHFGNFNWDDWTAQVAQIAGDCVDLNTENPLVYNYLIKAYSQFIELGVDGFRIDTGRHISRLTFNNAFNNAFHEAAQKAGKPNFFMFTEICTRVREIWNRGIPAISTPFYTWKESENYNWNNDSTQYKGKVIGGSYPTLGTNDEACMLHYNDNSTTTNQPRSTNALLNGNDYHSPDYTFHSGLNVIDFPMHWNFRSAAEAFSVATSGDWAYNDATWNVTYVDSHDYAPDGAPEKQRFAQPQDTWAENLSLMFTFRGIPCLYYGSEIEFKKGMTIDEGPNIALINSGRAYFGGYITGSINTTDFAQYNNAIGNIATTLNHPLSKHIQRLNLIRMAVPALRKGQYSTEGCSGSFAFKRRYTDANTDSYALICISGGATFSNIPNGTYSDAVTGQVMTVANNTLSVSNSGKGNLRVFVLSTTKTAAPGKVGEEGKYLYTNTPVIINQGIYDGKEEALEPPRPEITILPVSGKYPDPFGVTITATSTNQPVTIYYTLDGTLPSPTNGLIYNTPFTISENTTVKAVCIDSQDRTSIVQTTTYIMGLDTPVLNFSPSSRSFNNGTSNSISIGVTPNDANTKIYYTTDGTDPSTSSPIYISPILITGSDATITIKAIAKDKLNQYSTIASSNYLFTSQPLSLVVHVKVVGYNQAPFIYAWNDNPLVKYCGDWPGTLISGTPDSNGFYTYIFPNSIYSSNLIFSKGVSQPQTADIIGVNKETYFFWDGVNKSLPSISLSIPKPSSADMIKIYPTIVDDFFNVLLPAQLENMQLQIKLLNVEGKSVYVQNLVGATTKINCNHLKKGIYLLQINEKGKIILNTKLMIR